MLTKTDLSQIGQVIDEKSDPVKKDLTSLKKDVKYLKKTVVIFASKAQKSRLFSGTF